MACNEAIKLNPQDTTQNAAAWSIKGYALHRLGKFEEAIKAFDKALELVPFHEKFVVFSFCLGSIFTGFSDFSLFL